MKKIPNTSGNATALMAVNSSLKPLGAKSSAPLSVRLTAQIELSRTNCDLTLAQKATDLAIEEAGKDIAKYITVVILNEMEILIFNFKSISEEKDTALLQSFVRLHKLIIKYNTSHKGLFMSGNDGTFERILCNLICVYLSTGLDLGHSTENHADSKVNHIDSLREMIIDADLMVQIDLAIWRRLFENEYNKLLTKVFWEIIYSQNEYTGPVEPEYDPDFVFPKSISDLTLDFVSNPRYTSEENNKIARNDIWICNSFYNAIRGFINGKLFYESEQVSASKDTIQKELTVLYRKFATSKIEIAGLIPAIKKIVKDNISK